MLGQQNRFSGGRLLHQPGQMRLGFLDIDDFHEGVLVCPGLIAKIPMAALCGQAQ